MSVENLYNKESGEVINPNIVSENIPAGAITSSKIASGAVAGGNIIDGAITSAKVADGAITSAKLASNSVSNSKIQDSAVSANKLAEGAVTEGKIVSGAVTRAKIGNKAVNIGKLNIYTTKYLTYLRDPDNITDFLQSVFQDFLNEVVTNTLIQLQLYFYNGNEFCPVNIYYDLQARAVYLYILDETQWVQYIIQSSTPWATAYGWLKDIYITYLL